VINPVSKFFVRNDFLTYFRHVNQIKIMSHHHDHDHGHGHQEAEQNEIGGPVTFAIFCFAAAVVLIYFIGSHA
jgi:hypothetical protein